MKKKSKISTTTSKKVSPTYQKLNYIDFMSYCSYVKHPHTIKLTTHYTYSTPSHISLSDVTKNLGLLT